MGFLTPLALSLAALSVPLLILYMLKLRREERMVSSTMLWQQVLRDRRANAPWQRLKRNLLLLLQLLALALLVVALARPYTEIGRLVQGNVILLLDASASMQATDVSPTRFERARDLAQQIAEGMGPNDTMTVIAVGYTPRVLAAATHDRATLRQALAAAEGTYAQADWQAAFLLASSSAGQARDNTTVILSDGGLGQALPDLPGRVQYVPVGVSAENLAIAALAVRDGPSGPQAFVRVVNAGAQPQTAVIEVYVDGALFDARSLSLAPGSEQGLSLNDLPLDTRQVEARLTPPTEDALQLDDRAWALRTPGPQATVLLATTGNAFLERAIALMPGLTPLTIRVTDTLASAQLAAPPIAPALYIYDGVLPAALPDSGNLFFLSPPAGTDLFAAGGVLTQTEVLSIERDDPRLRYVDLTGMQVSRARAIVPPPWSRTLVEAAGGPLLLAGETNGRRVAILAFDLHHSDLPLRVAFPILMANLTRWLAPTDQVDVPSVLRPGMPVALRPQMGANQVVFTSPSGRQWTYPVESNEAIPFAQTQELGVYVIEQQSPEESYRALFAVNLFSELESQIAPQDDLSVGTKPVRGQRSGIVARREWWRWVALAGLTILLIEWVVYWRR